MSAAKVLIFAPVDEARDTHAKLQEAGCELRLGKASWDTPHGNNEGELAQMATGCDALMGTSIRNAPISRKVMESSAGSAAASRRSCGRGRCGSWPRTPTCRTRSSWSTG